MYLVASLAMAAEQRKVGTCGTVLWSIVVKTLWVYPRAAHLAGREEYIVSNNQQKIQCCSFSCWFYSLQAGPTVRSHTDTMVTSWWLKYINFKTQHWATQEFCWNNPPAVWLIMVLSPVQMCFKDLFVLFVHPYHITQNFPISCTSVTPSFRFKINGIKKT